MLASDPASILNQNRTDLGIPNRFNPKESDSRTHPQQTSGRAFAAISFVYLSVECSFENSTESIAAPSWVRNCSIASTVGRDQSLVDARDRSFQSAPCFCQFIRMWRLVALFLPSATAWLSASQWNRTIAASPTTRILGSWYSSDKNFDFPSVALAMNVALSSTLPSEWL